MEELQEDYAWSKTAMEALEGLSVPCDRRVILSRWQEGRVIDTLKMAVPGPRRVEDGLDGILADLVEIGVFRTTTDGRVNIPDVYRVAFRLGRRGGVRPVR